MICAQPLGNPNPAGNTMVSLPPLLLGLLIFIMLELHLSCSTLVGGRPHHITVRGIALCDSCQQNRLSLFSLPMYGASITLTCKRGAKQHTASLVRKSRSDKNGGFAFALPFSEPRSLRRCKVELTSSPLKACSQRTRYSSKRLSPILKQNNLRPTSTSTSTSTSYSSGWLSFQPSLIPNFCNYTSFDPASKLDQNASNFLEYLPQGFSFAWLPPLPGSPTPSFPFNFFPPSFPLPNFPGGPTSPTTNPFPFPPVPGFPPSTPNFPWIPPFPSFPFPFPAPGQPSSSYNFPPLDFSSFPNGWGFPPLPPLNPSSPTTPQNPSTPFTNLPPLVQYPPGLQIPPNPFFPSTPLDLFTPKAPSTPVLPLSPTLKDPSLPPNPFSPSTPP